MEDLRNNGNFYVFAKNHIMGKINEMTDFKEELKELNDALLPYDLGFGYRVVDEIALFVYLAKQQKYFLPDFEGKSLEKAKDLAVLMKVLPKFHGPRAKLEKPLVEVLKWCRTPQRESAEDKQKSEENTPEGQPETEEGRENAQNQSREKEASTLEEEIRKVFGIEKKEEIDLRRYIRYWKKEGWEKRFKYPLTAKKVTEMLARLYEIGFTSFM
jgi:hypothetical protein